MHNFTPEDLVQYLYAETSPDKTAAIKTALEADFNLLEQFETIAAGKQRLEAFKMSPRKQTIDNILRYAEKAITEVSAQA